jgi:hypothetical protein
MAAASATPLSAGAAIETLETTSGAAVRDDYVLITGRISNASYRRAVEGGLRRVPQAHIVMGCRSWTGNATNACDECFAFDKMHLCLSCGAMKLITMGETVPPELQGGVAAIGNFDGVHRGHQVLLEAAAQTARELGVPWGLISFEPHPKTFFRPQEPVFLLCPPLSRHGSSGRWAHSSW